MLNYFKKFKQEENYKEVPKSHHSQSDFEDEMKCKRASSVSLAQDEDSGAVSLVHQLICHVRRSGQVISELLLSSSIFSGSRQQGRRPS